MALGWGDLSPVPDSVDVVLSMNGPPIYQLETQVTESF